MCCRYFLWLKEHYDSLIGQASASSVNTEIQKQLNKSLKTEGEIFPADVSIVYARNRKQQETGFPMVWGYTGNGKQPIINARSETAKVKTMFRESWLHHRCLIPASCYYEWKPSEEAKGKKIRYQVQTENEPITWLCGLYRMENGIPHYVILTREPSESMRFLHDRMPLILPENRIHDWTDPSQNPDRILASAVTELRTEIAS